MVSLGNYLRRRISLQLECVVKNVCHLEFFGVGVEGFCAHPDLDEVALGVSHLRVEVQQGPDLNPEKKEVRGVNPFISFEMRFDLPNTIIDNLVNCVDLKISKNLCVTQRVYFSYIMSLQKPQPDLKAQTRGIGFCFRLFSG